MSAVEECDVPSVDKTTQDSEEEDSHRCGTCKLEFGSIEDFIKHKLDKDNCRVYYQKSSKDKRVLVPKLIKKETVKDDDDRETNKSSQKRKRKTYFSVDQENIVEKTSHKCPKCSRTFNREATLRRHVDIEHDSTWEIVNDEIGRDEDDSTEGPVATLLQAAGENSGTASIEVDGSDSPVFQAKKMKHSLNDDRPFPCEVCGSKFKEMSVLKTHLLTHSDQRDFPCPFEGCTYAFKTKGSLKRHERRHTGDRPYKCHLCQRSFAESGALTRHLKSRTPCTSKSDADLPRYGRKIQFASQDTPLISDESEKLPSSEGDGNEAHSVQVLIGAAASAVDTVTQGMTTPVSNNSAVSTALPTVDSQHGDNIVVATLSTGEITGEAEDFSMEDSEDGVKFEQLDPNQCRVCKVAMSGVDTLIEHLKTHLSGLPFRCGSCNFCTDKKEYLAGHMKERHRATLREIGPDGNEADVIPDNPPPMNSYLFRLSKEGSMAAKQLLILGDKSPVEDPSAAGYKTLSKCPVCGRTFKGSSYLKLHMRSHTGERPHQCPHCPKTFTTKDTLSKHLTAHSEARHYKCGECGKLFKRISHVKEHLKIHTNERPYKCTFCDKTFKTTNACKVHLRTHGSEMPWECKFCHRLFREKGSLERHIRTHTGEKPYSCQYCGRKFAEHGTLNRHLKAKAPCTQQLKSVQESQVSAESSYPTVLAQFSSVVTDTQHYILEGQEEEMTDSQPAAEYVVVDNESNIQVQNIEVVGTAQDSTTQYVILNQPDGNTIAVATSDPTSILDSLSSMASMSSTPTMTTVTASGHMQELTTDDVTIVAQGEELPEDVLEGLVVASGGEVTQVVQGLESETVNVDDAVVGLVDS